MTLAGFDLPDGKSRLPVGKWLLPVNLSDEFDAADETLSEILDGLVVQFQATNAKFVSDYNNARTIVDASASHASPNQPTPAPTPAASKP